MGDMADFIMEQGFDEYIDHLHGYCDSDGPCQWCEEEEASRKKRKAKKRTPTRGPSDA